MIVSTARRVLRAISLRSGDLLLDERDHPVEEGLAGAGSDAHHDLIRQDTGATGHGRTVATGFADPGADSPVMADSSTEAMPSMISPSEGIISGRDDDNVVDSESRGGDLLDDPPALRLLAMVSALVLRNAAAWAALSAMTSAKLAKRTVNTTTPPPTRRRGCLRPSVAQVLEEDQVVKTLPTSTTNMTGLQA